MSTYLVVQAATAALGVALMAVWLRSFRIGRHFAAASARLRGVRLAEASRPSVSVIVPARDEAEDLPACLDSLAAQQGIRLEVILVNDRSRDATGGIMRGYAQNRDSWHYIEITELPAGWLGKTHAMHVAGERAGGDYLLFTDGDVVFAPDALARGAEIAAGNGLDHLVLIPRACARGPLLAAMQAHFLLVLMSRTRIDRVGRDTACSIGIGQFNLVRRTTYRHIGGHRRLRLAVVDDLMLGRLLAGTRARQGVADGVDLIGFTWYPSARAMVRGLEKNLFAALGYRPAAAAVSVARTLVIHVVPYVAAALVAGPARYVVVAAIVVAHSRYLALARWMGYAPATAILAPAGAVVFAFAVARSAVVTLHRGAITWRGTRYRLADLRAEKPR